MVEKFFELINNHDFFILTTHDPADADGIGAQLVLSGILSIRKKQCRIINASPIPEQFRFMDPDRQIEKWDSEKHHALPEKGALIILDTADEYNIGAMIEAYSRSREVFVIDHHEPKPNTPFPGIYDSKSASTSELMVELAEAAGVTLDSKTAFAAYIGIVYDTGFFSYPKTGPRTLRAALRLLERGVDPSEAFNQLCQNTHARTLLLQRKAVMSMSLNCGNRVAIQVLRMEDFLETGASQEDTDGFVNFPLKSREIVISLLIKETPDKKIRCSLRSKGTINVAKIAQEFGGGGHINASGFKSDMDLDQTLAKTLTRITAYLEGK